MAQVTKAVVQGILGGQGYTDNEVRQLANYWLAKNGGEDAPQAGAESYPQLHREWKFALQEALDTFEAEIDSRGDEENRKRMKRASTILSSMLASANATAALRARGAVPNTCRNAWFLSLPEGRQAVLREDKWMLANAAYEAGRAGPAAPSAAGEREYHAALQRVGTALGLAPGANILTDCVPAIEALRASAPMSAQPSGWAQGVEAVAKMIEKKYKDFADEYGYDDMGGLSFGSGANAEAKMDWHSGLVELEEEVRAMLAAAHQPPAAPGEQDAQAESKRLRHALSLAVGHLEMDALRVSHCKDAAAIDAALAAKGQEGGAAA